MSVSYPLSIPSTVGTKTVKLALVDQAASFISDFTGQRLVENQPGVWYEAVIEFRAMDPEADGRDLTSFLWSLRGQRGTFKYWDPDYQTSRGDNDGSDKTFDSITTAGDQIDVSGFKNNTTDVMKKGDFIEINSHLKMVRNNADSDGSGVATLDIEPAFRNGNDPSNGDNVIIDNPQATLKPMNSKQEINSQLDQMKVTLACREDI